MASLLLLLQPSAGVLLDVVGVSVFGFAYAPRRSYAVAVRWH